MLVSEFETDSKSSSYEIIGILISIVYVKIIESQSGIKMFRWKVDIENRERSDDQLNSAEMETQTFPY